MFDTTRKSPDAEFERGLGVQTLRTAQRLLATDSWDGPGRAALNRFILAEACVHAGSMLPAELQPLVDVSGVRHQRNSDPTGMELQLRAMCEIAGDAAVPTALSLLGDMTPDDFYKSIDANEALPRLDGDILRAAVFQRGIPGAFEYLAQEDPNEPLWAELRRELGIPEHPYLDRENQLRGLSVVALGVPSKDCGKVEEKVASILLRPCGIPISTDPGTRRSQIVVGEDSSLNVLWSSVMALVNEGQQVLIPQASFDPMGAIVEGCKGIAVPLSTAKENYRLTAAAIEAAVAQNPRGTFAAIVVTNPGNALGVALKRHELQEILDVCVKHGIRIIADEHFALLEYSGESVSLASLQSSINGTTVRGFDWCVVLRGSSKYTGVEVTKIGIACSGDAVLIDRIRSNIAEHFHPISPIFSEPLVKILDAVSTEHDRDLAALRVKAQLLADGVEAVNKKFGEEVVQLRVAPEAGFFACLWFKADRVNAANSFDLSLRLNAGIGFATRQVESMGLSDENWIPVRINFSLHENRFPNLLEAIEVAVERPISDDFVSRFMSALNQSSMGLLTRVKKVVGLA